MNELLHQPQSADRNELLYILCNGAAAVVAGLIGGILTRWAFPAERREQATEKSS